MCCHLWKASFVPLIFALALAVTASATIAVAQTDYPTKPPQLIVGWAAGGSSDLTARKVAELIKNPLGKPMVVVNRPGAAGVVAANEVIKATPDGYTVLLVKIGQAVLQIVRGTATYKTDDLEPVAALSASPILLAVRGDSKFKSLKDIVEASKAQPGVFRFGHSAVGGAPHLAMELLASKAGIKVKHVPFQGSSEGIAALLGGHIDAQLLDPPGEGLEFLKTKEFRPICVFEEKRIEALPDIPTAKELGYDSVVRVWTGLAVPKGTPPAVKDKLASAAENVAKDPAFVKFLTDASDVPMYLNPGDFKALWLREQAAFKPILESLGLVEKK
jgi:tripartite-type tricarboxylate transporter receptor subunit TctC